MTSHSVTATTPSQPALLDGQVVERFTLAAERALTADPPAASLHAALAGLPGVMGTKICLAGSSSESESNGIWAVACGTCAGPPCRLAGDGAVQCFDVPGRGVLAVRVATGGHFAPYAFLVAWLGRQLARTTTTPPPPSEEELGFRAIVDHFPDHVGVYDREGRRTYVNPVMARALGQTQKAALGQQPRNAHAGGGFGEYQERLSETVQTGKVSEMELVLPESGKLTYCHVRFAPLRNRTGEIVGSIAVGRDTSGQHLDDDALRRLWFATEQSPVSIVITDGEGRIQHVNAKFTEVSGYSKDEALGRNPRFLKSGQTNPEVYAAMWTALSQGGTWRGEFCNRKKNGELYWERAVISPVINAQGVRTSYVAVKEDITEQKQLEAKLRQVQKMEAFGQLAAGVAHDFNNLLTVILGNASEARTRATDPDTANALTDVEDAAARAATLTRQLLTFSRRQVPRKQRVDLAVVVSDTTRMLRRLIGEQVSLQTRCEPPAPLHADPSMLELVLVNLAVNARDAMPRGGTLAVDVDTVEVDAPRITAAGGRGVPGAYLRLSVRDSGTGIDPRSLPHIFEPFFTTKEAGRGTGLGLATVAEIVQHHAGFIEVESVPGAGTTFRVFLPRAMDAAVASHTRTEQAVPGGEECILLVEDDPGVRSLLVRGLERAGYRVRSATSGEDALRLWRRYRPEIDMVLTDLVMPGVPSGQDLAVQVLAQEPDLPVILMSGYTAGDPALVPGLERVRFLPKPVATAVLLQSVRDALEASDHAQQRS